jgi:hypothetical protein
MGDDMTDHEAANERVKTFIAARAAVGDDLSQRAVIDIHLGDNSYSLYYDDLRILSGWDGQPMEHAWSTT